MENTVERTAAEVAEIERHKYFLSENAGHDVGWDHAEQDWLTHHADRFRAEQNSASSTDVQDEPISVQPPAIPPTASVEPVSSAPALPEGTANSGRGIGMLFRRLFARSGN